MRSATFVPRFPSGSYGEDKGFRFLVMERMTENLSQYAACRPAPTLSDIADIGIKLIGYLREIHGKSLLFVDVKPENFMLCGDPATKDVRVIDFGLAKSYMDPMTGKHKEPNPNGGGVGTPSFMSISVQKGCDGSRRDDIEALGYVLLSLRSDGNLPWSKAKSEAECLALKIKHTIAELSSELGCQELGQLIDLSRALGFSSIPEYDKYISLLQKMKERNPSIARREKEKRPSSSRFVSKPKSASSKNALSAQADHNSDELSNFMSQPSPSPSSRSTKTPKKPKTAEKKSDTSQAKNKKVKIECDENNQMSPPSQPSSSVSTKATTKVKTFEGNTDVGRTKKQKVVIECDENVHDLSNISLKAKWSSDVYRIPLSGITIGKSKSAGISLVDQYLSDMHVHLSPGREKCTRDTRSGLNKDRMIVKDLTSTNGTKVNDKKLKPGGTSSISIGDTLRVGSLEFLVERNEDWSSEF
jgi:serine/threonine protein kinase